MPNELTTEQQAVATVGDEHVVVLAGPGTGKTKAVVARIHYLLESGVDPASIAVFTFSRRAARELRERVGDGKPFWRMHIGTFHSVLYSTMMHGPCVLSQEAADMRLELAALRVGLAKKTRDRIKFKTGSRSAWRKELDDFRMGESVIVKDHRFIGLSSLVDEYESLLRIDNAIDYAGIIAHGIHGVGNGVLSGVKYVIVDEAQDTDFYQWRLIHKLSSQAIVMAVGDANQCIYEWRGVRLDDFLLLPWKRLPLSRSFRCPTGVVAAANSVAKYIGGEAELVSASNVESEVKLLTIGVVDAVWSLKESLHSDESIAILCRYNEHVELYSESLRSAGIPVRVVGGQSACGPLCSLILYLNSPGNPVLKAECVRLMSSAMLEMDNPMITGICTNDIETSRLKCLDWLSGMGLQVSPGLVIRCLNVPQFMAVEAEKIKELYSQCTLKDAAVELLSGEMDGWSDDARGVSVMTIHQAKGLEWPAVIIPDCNEGLFPRHPKRCAEDRRLFYVAMTRTQEDCAILYRAGMDVSRFITESGLLGDSHDVVGQLKLAT